METNHKTLIYKKKFIKWQNMIFQVHPTKHRKYNSVEFRHPIQESKKANNINGNCNSIIISFKKSTTTRNFNSVQPSDYNSFIQVS